MTNPDLSVDRQDIWRAYEAAQKHYDSDFTLFTNRMNLFLLVESALITVGVAAVLWQSLRVPGNVRIALSVLGIALSAAWFLAAVSTYRWVKTIRQHWILLGEGWEARSGVTPSATMFSKERRLEVKTGSNPNRLRVPDGFIWYLRPSFILCGLPALYMAGWVTLLVLEA